MDLLGFDFVDAFLSCFSFLFRVPSSPLLIVEVDALKIAPSFGLRHRRDSISGLSIHSQPLGPAYGTQSPAPTYHSQGLYLPCLLSINKTV